MTLVLFSWISWTDTGGWLVERDKRVEWKRSKCVEHRFVEREGHEGRKKIISVYGWAQVHTHTHTYRRIEFPWEWKHQDIAVLFSWNTLRFTHQIWTFKTFNRKTISPFLYTVSCTRLPVPTPDDMRFLFQYGCLFRVEDACTISKITSGHIFYQLMLI